ncbi:alcohol oxidase [Infundibulicybe gibba]|nr:alcohol oxidase [Infundibulicybe gibba]
MSNSNAGKFDYVIIGGGLAGLVLAARLTEGANVTVGVIEAGGDVSHLQDVQVPGFFQRGLTNPNIDWTFMSTPQPAVNNRQIYLPRGKGIGGSSVLNFMTLGRASAKEYDTFETLGSNGWNWRGLIEYFKKSETVTISPEIAKQYGLEVDPTTAGTSGPLQRTLPSWISELQAPFFKAMNSLGVPANSDISNGNVSGVGVGTNAIDPVSCTRSSSASAYYEPNKGRANLHMISHARATQIVFERNESNIVVAKAVKYSKNGVIYTVNVRREVILCAGSFQTPQVLELSGLGDPKILETHGIPVLVDLPGVGRNLQEHIASSFTAEMNPEYDSLDALRNPERAAAEWKLYETEKKGILSAVASVAFGFIPTSAFVTPSTMSISKHPSNVDLSPAETKTIQMQREWLTDDDIPYLEVAQVPGFYPAAGKEPADGKKYFSIFLAVMHPFSRGTVHIGSNDPLANPTIDPQLLSHPLDLELLVDAIKYARKIVSTDVLRPIVRDEVAPGPDIQSDEKIREYVKENLATVFHPVGTASMLPREDGGVVDADLRVYGTANLRVVDASVIPIQLTCHTQATVYALAEKAADIIKKAAA